jgi:hypothetical protein
VNYDNASPNCANNLKVYQLDPRNGFTVDIFPLDDTGAAGLANGTESSCIDDVAEAIWNGSMVEYDYGTNTITFEVVAANFTGYFTPEFRIGTLGNGQTAQLQWSYSPTFATIDYTHGTTITAAGGVFTSTVNAETDATDTSLGVSIYARLIISNNTFEAIAATPIRVAVDAVNSAGERDIVNSDCTLQTAFEDEAVHNLDPRPTVTPTTPTGGFVPANSTN